MAEFILTLPLPPSVNHLHQGMGNNRRRTTKYAAWAEEAGWRINEAKAAGRFRALPSDRWYWTDIRLPHNHLGDSDNRLKALHDLLHAMGATPDDQWLIGGTYMRCPDVAAGTCVVSAVSIEGEVSDHWRQVKMIAERVLSADEPKDDWRSIGEIAADMVKGQVS